MNMQVPLHVFETAEPQRLRRGRNAPAPRSRILALVVTVLAHILAVIAIVAGLRQANRVVLHAPDAVTVQIDARKPQNRLEPLPVPAMLKPSTVTAPMPMIDIAPASHPVAAPAPVVPTAAPPPPAPSVPPPPSRAPLTWQSLLLARLEAAKRYPAMALARRQEGVAVLHFTMDRDGNVLSAEIKKGSGYDLLDQETLALIHRAEPLPKPPAEVMGNPLSLDVPVEFYLHGRH